MEYINFGASGLKVSKLSFGTWYLPQKTQEHSINSINEEMSKKVIQKAYDLGINFFDTATVYYRGESERILGEVLQGYDRESLVISSKVRGKMAEFPNGEGLSRKHIMWQIRETLRRLKTDYVDIYIMHWPDPSTPIEESAETLADIVKQGKVHYLGASNFHPDDIPYIYKLFRELHTMFIALQDPYNFLERFRGSVGVTEKYRIPLAKKLGLGIMAYSPLAQGVLTGKYNNGIPKDSRATINMSIVNRYLTQENLNVLKEFHEVAKELGVTDAQLALAWILKISETNGVSIVPIIGASRPEQLEEDVEAVNIKITDDIFRRLDELSRKTTSELNVNLNRIKKLSYELT